MWAGTLIALLTVGQMHVQVDGDARVNWINDVYHQVNVDPEVNMNVTQLITSKGYPCEEYDVHTQDGYILGVQRIPHGRHRPRAYYGAQTRPVVLLQHGLLSSSADWVDNPVHECLGFLLADAGFDVWLANSRGNTYALRHEKYNPNQEQFWDFSWDEMAAYDLPATIDRVLSETGASQLVYIGYSQGTQTMFAHLSRNQSLAAKIKLMIAMAPVAYLKNIESPIALLAPFAKDLGFLFTIFGVKDFMPSDGITKWLAKNVCGHEIPDILCENVLFLFGGYDFQAMNASRIPVYVAHSPAGTSVRNIIHYAQSTQSGKFRMFDFGASKNQQRYNQTTPPEYNPKNVHVPMAVFSATADWLADPDDVTKLLSELPNVIYHRVISGWEHLDFTWAVDAPKMCYDEIIQLIRLHYNIAW